MAEPNSKTNAPPRGLVGSLFALKSTFVFCLLLVLLIPGWLLKESNTTQAELDAFVCDTARQWRAKHGEDSDLQVARVDVRFQGRADLFAKGDGAVVVPAGLSLAGAQELVETAAYPQTLRTINADGIVNQVWEYAGRVHKDMRFVALTLVRRPPRRQVAQLDSTTSDSLDTTLKWEAGRTAKELEEHGLDDCASFKKWAIETAWEPPATAQLLRIVQAMRGALSEDSKADDICAAIRKNDFTTHRAHVAATMAAREAGIPAFAFTAAHASENHLIGTFVDEIGWITADVKNPDAGLFVGGAALLTRVPLISSFAASDHDFWRPAGAAYSPAGGWMPVHSMSSTKWSAELEPDEEPTDTTETTTVPLKELCP